MKKFLFLFIVLVGAVAALTLLGFVFFPRPEPPAAAPNESCEQYNIRFDASSIEKIYQEPEAILADPQAFLSQDRAYTLLAQSRDRGADPFRYEAWLQRIEKLASQSRARRERQVPFALYELIMAHQGAFCREIGPSVLSYLPEGTDLEVTLYLTALDEPVPAYAGDQSVAFSLSHPLFRYSAMIHLPTGLSTFFNLALQEIHHIGFAGVYPWPTVEELVQDEIVIDMLTSLHRESVGTYIEYKLLEKYPSPFEYFLYLVNKELVVRQYVKAMNDLFTIAKTRPEPSDPAYNQTYRQIGKLCYRRKGFYIVGGYMAMRIDEELGREALVQTITDGYESFVEAFNTIAAEDMKIRYR